ncbi:MAG: hypothetical protein V2I33_20790 [Kangiellaceae bacterium]|jgi:hypothetical protein|nr:hypothetical protein [Kangiellaceae bacterium]
MAEGEAVVTTTRQVESTVINCKADMLWAKFRDQKWDELLPERVQSVTWGEGGPHQIGATFTITYTDGSVWTYCVTEISDPGRLITTEVLASEPALHVHSVINSIKVRRVTSTDQAFVTWTTDFSNDVTAEIIADNKYKKIDAFETLASHFP